MSKAVENGEEVACVSFGEQMRRRREELGMTRQQLAQRLGVSVSAVGNYETGVSAPKEEVLLRLFTALEAEPNYLYRGSFRDGEDSHSDEERRLLAKYRDLPLSGRQTVHSLVDALTVMTGELRAAAPAAPNTARRAGFSQNSRVVIPLQESTCGVSSGRRQRPPTSLASASSSAGWSRVRGRVTAARVRPRSSSVTAHSSGGVPSEVKNAATRPDL